MRGMLTWQARTVNQRRFGGQCARGGWRVRSGWGCEGRHKAWPYRSLRGASEGLDGRPAGVERKETRDRRGIGGKFVGRAACGCLAAFCRVREGPGVPFGCGMEGERCVFGRDWVDFGGIGDGRAVFGVDVGFAGRVAGRGIRPPPGGRSMVNCILSSVIPVSGVLRLCRPAPTQFAA